MNDIQDKVMQANGINHSKVDGRQLKGIHDLIKRERILFSLTKILTGFFWTMSLIILGGYMVAGKIFRYYLRREPQSFNDELATLIMALETILPLTIIIAAVCTGFLFIRAKSVNLLQVHERLGNLEEMVKVLLSK